MSNNTNAVTITISGASSTIIDSLTYLLYEMLQEAGADVEATLIETRVSEIKELVLDVESYTANRELAIIDAYLTKHNLPNNLPQYETCSMADGATTNPITIISKVG